MSDPIEERLCCLCTKPIIVGPIVGQIAQYMGNLGCDMWAHKSCYQARYHPQVRQEPAEVQAAMFGQEDK